jgi:hypothetical protein
MQQFKLKHQSFPGIKKALLLQGLSVAESEYIKLMTAPQMRQHQ